jgi:hypothetical protein
MSAAASALPAGDGSSNTHARVACGGHRSNSNTTGSSIRHKDRAKTRLLMTGSGQTHPPRSHVPGGAAGAAGQPAACCSPPAAASCHCASRVYLQPCGPRTAQQQQHSIDSTAATAQHRQHSNARCVTAGCAVSKGDEALCCSHTVQQAPRLLEGWACVMEAGPAA